MDIKRENKEKAKELYDEHFELLLAVYKIGNKIMLQKQLYILCKRIGIKKYKDEQYFNRVIKKMEKSDMIERHYKDGKNNHKWITLRNPWITKISDKCKELYGYSHNNKSVSKEDKTEGRFGKSMFQTEYLIQKCHFTFVKENNINGIQDLISYHMKNSSLLYESGKAYPFMTNFFDTYNKQIMLNQYEIKPILNDLRRIDDIRVKSNPYNRKKYNESKESVELPKESAKDFIANEFNNMLDRNSNIFISGVKTIRSQKKDRLQFDGYNQVITVDIDMFDTKDNVSADTIGNRIRETAVTLYRNFDGLKFVNMDKCQNCPKYTECIIEGFKGTPWKKLDTECKEEPGQINRIIRFNVTIYTLNEQSRVLMKNNAENKAQGSNLTELDKRLNEGNYFGGKLTTQQMKITYKSLDLDKKYSIKAKNESKNDALAKARDVKSTKRKNKPKNKPADKSEIIDKLSTVDQDVLNQLDNIIDLLKKQKREG